MGLTEEVRNGNIGSCWKSFKRMSSPTHGWTEINWRAQGDDHRTFLAEFVSILPQSKIPAQIEALIYGDL